MSDSMGGDSIGGALQYIKRERVGVFFSIGNNELWLYNIYLNLVSTLSTNVYFINHHSSQSNNK
jgi:hypothetical protein